ncbi:condensin-2 complex subunit G2 isoform 2-T2 [Pangshura tecta]
MTRREAFLQVVSTDTVEEFVHYMQLHKDPFDPFDLNELLQELPRKQKEALWERLTHLLTHILVKNPVEGWQRIEDESDDDMEIEESPKMKQMIAVIQGVTTVVTASIPVVDENINYKALLECALILNGILYALSESEKVLQGAIQQLCAMWWEKGLEGKQQLGKTAFIMLLRKSLKSKTATGADILRLWHLHQTLLCFDYDLEETNEVKDLLLQCFMSVNHIKKEEGRRFLSFLLSWNVNFIKMIHGTIKNQLQCFSKSLMVYVAEIYFRAWKKASGEILEILEHNCIQDFMHHGIHLPRSSPVHPKVRELLSYFHKQSKVRQGVEEMLYRLYQPILWRALKARNSEVRSNAALLFVEAFPIRDPHFKNEDMDNEIQKQFEELFSLLEDPQPLVRSTGVLGVSKITSKYWDMIPATILAELLKKLIGDLAFDVTSADVRCSVFKCLPIILDNKLSHPLLEQLLPTVKYSLHDNSEKVRVAFVDMLLKIKAVRAAKFWKICPMEHLLTRLEVDSRPVSRRLVNLLFNSFLPVNQPEELWCERCVTLIQMNPAAARKFYWYAYEYTAPTNIAKFMLTIRRCLNACIQRAIKENQDDDEGSEKENISDDRCMIPLVILASFMPASAIPTFSCGVISKLRNLEKGADENKYSTLIDCLCRWGQVGHIMELICDWMSDEMTPRKSNIASERRVRIQVTYQSKPELALDYLEYLLTHSMNRDCLLSVPKKKLNHLLKVLGAAKDILGLIMKATGTGSHSFNQATVIRAFTLYCRLSIHLQHKFSSEGKVYLSHLKETGAWIESHVLPFILMHEQEENVLEQHIEVSQLIIQAYLTMCKDAIMVGLGDTEFQAHLLDVTLSIMQTERGCFCIPTLLCILKEIIEASLTQNIDRDEELATFLHAVQALFQKILESVARRLRKQREEGLQLIHSIQMPLGEFIHTVQCWCSSCPTVHHGVLSTLLAAVVVEISHTLRKASNAEEVAPPESTADLPPLSGTLMAMIIKSINVVRSFLNELMECIVCEEIEGIISLTAAAYIVVIIKGKHKASLVKDIAHALQKKLMTCREVAIEESSNFERTLYESSVKILEDILIP